MFGHLSLVAWFPRIQAVRDSAASWDSPVPCLLHLPCGVCWNLGLPVALSTDSAQLGAVCQGSGWLQVMENSKVL